LPIGATVTSEIEIAAMGPEYRSEATRAFPYFQAIDTDRNKAFVERYVHLSRSEGGDASRAGGRPTPVFLEQAVEKAAEMTPTGSGSGEGTGVRRSNGHVKIDPEYLPPI